MASTTMHGRLNKTLAAALFWFVAVDAHAQKGPFVSPAGYYSLSGSSRHADNDYGGQLSFGYNFNDRWGLELLSETAKYKLDDGSGYFNLQGASFQADYNLIPDRSLSPIVLGGVGWLRSSLNGRHEDNAVARGGLGLQWQPDDSHLGVRAGAVVRHTFDNKLTPPTNHYDDLIVSLGLLYRLGNTRTEAIAERSVAFTPTYAGSNPAPIATQPAATTAHATAVQSAFRGSVSTGVSAPGDLDGDGVKNALDKCQDTPPNAVVDGDGCIMYIKRALTPPIPSAEIVMSRQISVQVIRILSFALSVAALTACSARNGGGGSGQPATVKLLADSYATLGPIAGGEVQITDLQRNIVAEGTTESFDISRDTRTVSDMVQLATYTSGRKVGQISVPEIATSLVKSEDLYLVSATGGQDVDPDDNGTIVAASEGAAGPSLNGRIYAVVTGADLVRGDVRISAITTLAYAGVQRNTDKLVVTARLDRLATYLLNDLAGGGDLNGDGIVDFRDLYAYDPSRITFTAAGFTADDDAGLRNAPLIKGRLNKKTAASKSFIDRLHERAIVADISDFAIELFGDVNRDGVANIFEDPTTVDSDGDGAFDATDTDIDGDGIPNDVELRLGLNPWSRDSDANGIEDGLEDSDGDSLSNASELNQYHTDPGNADSDRDGINDGDEVTYALDPTDPTDATEDADADRLSNIDEINRYLTNPTNADTDDDGLRDGDEVLVYKTDPLKKDTDLDALDDGDEINTYRTNPLLADTDKDGISDGDEVEGFLLFDRTTRVTTDPLSTDTDGDGIHDGIEKQVQDTFASYIKPENARAFLLGQLNPNNVTVKPDLGSLRFTDTSLTAAALELDPDRDGKPTIEELFHGTNPSSAASTFPYIYESSGSTARKPEFVALEAANFAYVPGAWDVDGDGVVDDGFLSRGLRRKMPAPQSQPVKTSLSFLSAPWSTIQRPSCFQRDSVLAEPPEPTPTP